MNGQVVEFPRAESLQRLALSDSGFVFDPVTGNSFTVNATGLAILRHLQHALDLAQVVAALATEFEVDEPTAEREVIEFAGHLRSLFR